MAGVQTKQVIRLTSTSPTPSLGQRILRILNRDKYLLAMALPAVVLLIIFRYIPMYGIIIAFEDYKPPGSFWTGDFVGFKHFIKLFNGPYFGRLMRNTVLLGLYSIVIGFPLPILLALSFNELKNGIFKKTAQTISYMPYFISTVIIIGILKDFLALDTGKINQLVSAMGFEQISFFTSKEWFRTLYIGSSVWQTLGYSSIIYLAALTGINPELYEAATIDGAGRIGKILHVSIPGILPTIMILLILQMPGIVGSDVQKVLLLSSPATYETSDVIGTYIYRQGVLEANYSFSAAVGLFMSVVSFIFLSSTNWISKRLTDTSLW